MYEKLISWYFKGSWRTEFSIWYWFLRKSDGIIAKKQIDMHLSLCE
jgi:hypothetical protein